MSALMKMLGANVSLPPFPCAVCTARALDPVAARLGEPAEPAMSETVALGTPVCGQHARELLGAFFALADRKTIGRDHG